MAQPAKKPLLVLAILLLLLGWWWMSWDFQDSFVAGSYVAKDKGTCNELTLNQDHSFTQKLWHGDRAATSASGTWRRFGEAGVAFSTSFLGASPDSVTSNNVYGMLDNTFGYHTLTINPQAQSLTFHKRFIHFTAACS